jgi:hypothetical protein
MKAKTLPSSHASFVVFVENWITNDDMAVDKYIKAKDTVKPMKTVVGEVL